MTPQHKNKSVSGCQTNGHNKKQKNKQNKEKAKTNMPFSTMMYILQLIKRFSFIYLFVS